MKAALFTILIIISFFAVIFALYAMIGFLDWIGNDPFDWIETPKPYQDPAIQVCIDKGGVPVKSIWNGDLKTCEITTLNQEQ